MSDLIVPNDLRLVIDSIAHQRRMFIEYYNSHATRSEYHRCLGEYIAYLRLHFAVTEIRATSDHVNAFKNHLLKNLQNNEVTINKKISVVSSYYTFLMRRKLISDNPVRFIRKFKVSNTGKSRAITRDEIEQIYRSLKEETRYQITIKTMIILLFETGIRVSELINLKTDNIIYDYGEYYLEFVQKGGKKHKVKLNDVSKYYIGRLLENENLDETSPDYIFKTKNGRVFDRKNLYRLIVSLGKKNELRVKIHPHTARVSYIREALETGREIYSIKKSVGHSSIKTTERYLG